MLTTYSLLYSSPEQNMVNKILIFFALKEFILKVFKSCVFTYLKRLKGLQKYVISELIFEGLEKVSMAENATTSIPQKEKTLCKGMHL